MNIQGIHPMVMAPVKAESAGGSSAAGTSGSSTSASGTSASSLQSTFLNLLVTELQNQDPTSPVDPTQMVSQMVSLNELNELVSINQTLTTMASGAASTSMPATPTGANVPQALAQSNTSSTKLPNNWVSMLPQVDSAKQAAYPGLMNLYGGPSTPTTTFNFNQTGAR